MFLRIFQQPQVHWGTRESKKSAKGWPILTTKGLSTCIGAGVNLIAAFVYSSTTTITVVRWVLWIG